MGQVLIVTDSVFSMDGDRANIDAMDKVAQQSGALLMQDDAHGFGVFKADIPKKIYLYGNAGQGGRHDGGFCGGRCGFY